MNTLLDSLKSAELHLGQALSQAEDWRVRSSIADAATIVHCALFIQKQIADGKLTTQRRQETSDCSRCVGEH